MSNKGKEKGPRMDKPRTDNETCEQNTEQIDKTEKETSEQGTEQRGKWDELIEIMDGLSGRSVHFVILLAKLYRDMEERGEVMRRPWYD